LDLTKVRIHTTGVPNIVKAFAWIKPGAFAFGYDVYFPTSGQGSYDPNSIYGLSRIAHELVHVEQSVRLGKEVFAFLYVNFSLYIRFIKDTTGQEGYDLNPFEVEAYARQRMIADILRKRQEENGGRPLCP
jgi:hypothetical protein